MSFLFFFDLLAWHPLLILPVSLGSCQLQLQWITTNFLPSKRFLIFREKWRLVMFVPWIAPEGLHWSRKPGLGMGSGLFFEADKTSKWPEARVSNTTIQRYQSPWHREKHLKKNPTLSLQMSQCSTQEQLSYLSFLCDMRKERSCLYSFIQFVHISEHVDYRWSIAISLPRKSEDNFSDIKK